MRSMVEKDETRRLLTVEEAAERCRISRPTYYRLARAGVVPAVRIGGSVRVAADELEDYIFSDPPAEVTDDALLASVIPGERHGPNIHHTKRSVAARGET